MSIIEKDIIVVGAGLTGLTTAFYLSKKGADFLVIEKKDRVGGVIHTESENGFLVESGPNTGVVGHPEVADLFSDLHGKCEIEIPGPTVNKRYILKNAKWEAIPNGLWKGIKTPLFSASDKLGLLAEPFKPKGTNPDETLADMVKRRLGKSILNYAVDPFIAGVYAGDPSKLVLRYALPKLYNLEQTYGSFIGGSIKKGFKKKSEEEKKATRKVFSVKGGLSQLTNSLYQAAGENNFHLSVADLSVSYTDGKYIASYKDKNGIDCIVKSKKLITTTGAFSLKEYMSFLRPEDLAPIDCLEYANVVEVVIGFNKWDGMNPDGFGGLIPSVENRDLLGVLFMSTLFANRTPGKGTSFTVFMGGMRKPDMYHKSVEEIKDIVKKEFMALMKPSAFNPDLFKVYYHKSAIPQYGVDSGLRFNQVELLEKKYPGLIIGGNLKDGIGMADRIKQGKRLALSAL